VNVIVRLNLDRADPPAEVIDAFRDVQAAEQERDRLERQADAYANRVLAGARGEAAQLLEEAEATAPASSTKPRVKPAASSPFWGIRSARGHARRLYLETMERCSAMSTCHPRSARRRRRRAGRRAVSAAERTAPPRNGNHDGELELMRV
jgi:regulator of protease activity HflC (stomatin/prohibitin superfamily)